MARIISALTFLLAITFSAEVLGYHARPFNTLLGLIFLALFLRPYVSRDAVSSLRTHWPGWLLAIVALVGVFCSSGWVSVLFISLLIGGIRLSRLDEEQDADLAIYQTTAFAYGLFLWFWRETATGWYMFDGAANGLMWVTHHLGLNATLGPTTSGMLVSFLLFIYVTSRALRTPGHRARTMLALIMSLLLVQIVFVAVYSAAGAALSMSLVQQRTQGAVLLWSPFALIQYVYPNNMQWIAFLLGLAPAFVLTRTLPLVQGKEKRGAPRRRAMIVGAGALLVGMLLAGFVPPRPVARGEVLIHDTGYLDCRMPVFGSYGDKSGGMFGRLPRFLNAGGYRVKWGPTSRESLRSANVLVVINLMEKFDRPTKKAIWDFVRRGGSLLALGDHTGTTSIREPFNDLLEPANIELNFDAAKAFRDGWLWAYSLPRHATTMGIDDAINEIEIWIGASLTVVPPARPVIIGSYGFSDPGDMANPQRGNLGNLLFDPGERLGDIPLAAECRYGRGKVLVFGDTSPLQNGALVYSHRFVENMFAWLSRPQASAADLARRLVATLLIVAGMVLLAKRARMHSWLSLAAAAVLVGWALGAVPAKALDAPITAHNNIAWIDASHLERFSLNSWVDYGFGGLTYNLMRNGYSPLLVTDWDVSFLKRGSLLILIAPSRSFSRSEVKSIRQFVGGGGHLILAAGWEDLSGSKELWDEFGLRVQQRPLGRVLVKQPGGDVRLYKGWSIKVVRGDPEVLCSPWGYPAIVKLRIGKGSVVAIADTQFLLDRNLEGTQRYYPENVDFLRRLFMQLKQNPTAVSGSRFRQPESVVDADIRRSSAQKGGQ